MRKKRQIFGGNMKLETIKLSEAKEKNEIDFEDKHPDEALPNLIYKKVERKIKDGAKDYKEEWKNALKLVDWALEELNISKPTSVSTDRWGQYLELIKTASQALHQSRGHFGTKI